MSDNSKSSTIPVDSENATNSRASRTRHLIALINLALLPALVALFLAMVSKRRVEPVYGWIADTPLAVIGDRLANLFGSRAFRLAGGFDSERRADAEVLVARMAARMPMHAAVTKDNTVFYGQIASRNDQRIELAAVDGRLNETVFIPTAEVGLVKPIVHPEVQLSQRDAQFMLRHENLRHFCLSPILVATDDGYAAAHDAYLSLSLLEEAFLNEFSPLVENNATRQRLLHVLITHNPQFDAASDAHHAANADAWYDPDHDTLVVTANAASPNRTTYLRHEGSHELTNRFALFDDYAATPLWLREGLALYCETVPFGNSTAARASALARKRLPWDTLLQPRSLEHLSEDFDPGVFYAQSWFLIAWLMNETRRPRFFRFLADNRGKTDRLADVITLMNALDSTTAKLDADLETYLRQRSFDAVAPSITPKPSGQP